MRCLCRLKAIKNQVYDSAYHAQLQGVLYDLLKEAGHEDIHDKVPFQFLTFSNIFPPQDMETGDERTWLIASPSKPLIQSLMDVLKGGRVEPGGQQFSVEDVSSLSINPGRKGTMITSTPIIVRFDRDEAEEHGIPAEYDKVYWRMEHSSNAFMEKIERNLAAKYERYYDRDAPPRPYFTGYKPRKEVSLPLQYADGDVTVIGTTWELSYECPNRDMHRLIQLAYSTGLGELNTTGFGFMNKVDD